MQLKYQAVVLIDCALMSTRLEHAARHYKWKVVKFKNGDYPFVEAMIQLAS